MQGKINIILPTTLPLYRPTTPSHRQPRSPLLPHAILPTSPLNPHTPPWQFNCNVVASENWLEKILPLGGHPDAQGTLTINVRRYSHPTINIRSATGLKNVGNKRSIFLKSNPYAKITGLSSSKNPQETEWARTTIKADTCDPKWNEKLECRLLNEGEAWGRFRVTVGFGPRA